MDLPDTIELRSPVCARIAARARAAAAETTDGGMDAMIMIAAAPALRASGAGKVTEENAAGHTAGK